LGLQQLDYTSRNVLTVLTGSKVSHVCQNIENGSNEEGDISVQANRLDRILGFGDHVECILKASVREDDFDESIRQAIGRSAYAFKRVVKVGCMRRGVATQDDKASNGNKHQSQHFDRTNAVGDVISVSGMEDNNCLQLVPESTERVMTYAEQPRCNQRLRLL
jgi:hypothetical protein